MSSGAAQITDAAVRQDLNLVVEATHPYEPQGPHQLALRKAELLLIVDKHPSGWWIATNATGAKGIVPSPFLKEVSLPPVSFDVEKELLVSRAAFDVGVVACGGVMSVPRIATTHAATPPGRSVPDPNATRRMEDLLQRRETVRRQLRQALEEIAKARVRSRVGTDSTSSSCSCEEYLLQRTEEEETRIAALNDELRTCATAIKSIMTTESMQAHKNQMPHCLDPFIVHTNRVGKALYCELQRLAAECQASAPSKGEADGHSVDSRSVRIPDCFAMPSKRCDADPLLRSLTALERAHAAFIKRCAHLDCLQGNLDAVCGEQEEMERTLAKHVKLTKETTLRSDEIVRECITYWKQQERDSAARVESADQELRSLRDKLRVLEAAQQEKERLESLVEAHRDRYLSLDSQATQLRAALDRIHEAQRVRKEDLQTLTARLRELKSSA